VPNVWAGVVQAIDEGSLAVNVDGLTLRSAASSGGFSPGQPVDVIIRAERINLRRDMAPDPPARNLLPALVISQYAYGSTHTLHLKPDGPGPEMEVEIAARPYEVLGVASRSLFNIEIEPEDIHVVPAATA
jgi:hypothetical protein